MLQNSRRSTLDRLKAVLEHPRAFDVFRSVLNGGTNLGPIRKALGAVPGESVLDVGCGLGSYSQLVGEGCRYLGVDLSERYVQDAQQRYGTAHKRFEARDVVSYPFAEASFDKVMMVNVLHHLDESQCDALLPVMARAAREFVLIVDPVPVPGRRIQQFWLSLDRGGYIRTLDDQKALLSRHFEIESVEIFQTRSRSATQAIYILQGL